MSSAWTGAGPVTLPPRGVAYTAGALVICLAVAGVGLGFRAAWRAPTEPGLGQSSAGNGDDDAAGAKPIVELPPPVTAPAPAKTEETAASDSNTATEEDKAKDVEQRTAEAQAVQAKSSKPSQDIDDILTSASEKPPAPSKPPADEAPPPEKSDVPF